MTEGWHARWYAELRSRKASTGLEAELLGARGAPARSLLTIYQRGYWRRLVDAILDLYPCTARALGGRTVTALARDFIHESPPSSPVLERVALGFGSWLRSRVTADVASLARLEAGILGVLIAPARSGRRVHSRELAHVRTFLEPMRLHDDVSLTAAAPMVLEAMGLLRGSGALGAEAIQIRGFDVPNAEELALILHRPHGTVLVKPVSAVAASIGQVLDVSASLQDALAWVQGTERELEPECLKKGLEELLELEALRYA